MKKYVFAFVALLALALAVPMQAQDKDCFRSEVYVGYTATMNGKEFSRNDIRNGGQVAFGVFAADWLQFNATLSVNRGPGEQVDLTLGPKINIRAGKRVNPFLTAGAGLQRSSFPTSTAQIRDAQFVWTGGGGLEINAGRFSFRVAQLEYVSAKQADGTQNRLRAGVGIAFRL